MCVVSMIGDYTKRDWQDNWPNKYPSLPNPFEPNQLPAVITIPSEVTKADFEALKAEVLRIKELLEAAAKFDAENNEPHCEVDDKVALLKKVAKLVGVDLSEIFEEPKKPYVVIGEPIVKYTNKFVVNVKFMHGDADIYTDEDLFIYDAEEIFQNAHRLIDSVRFLNELGEIGDGYEYHRHPGFETYGLDLPYDAHCGDYECLAQIEKINVIYYDADGVAFSVIVDGEKN